MARAYALPNDPELIKKLLKQREQGRIRARRHYHRKKARAGGLPEPTDIMTCPTCALVTHLCYRDEHGVRFTCCAPVDWTEILEHGITKYPVDLSTIE